MKLCSDSGDRKTPVNGTSADNDAFQKRLESLEECLKVVGTKKDSLRHERQRLRLLLGEKLPDHLEVAIREAWQELTRLEQVASLKQLEWRKISKLSQCRVEAEKSIAWLAGLGAILHNSYRDSGVGKTPLETAQLLQEQENLMRKAKEAYQFTERIIQALLLMCQSERQSTQVVDYLTQQLQAVWRPYQMQHDELKGRRDVAATVYEFVDSILTRVEAMLVTLANGVEIAENTTNSGQPVLDGKQVWRELLLRHNEERERIIDDYEETAKCAAALMKRLGLDMQEQPDPALEENTEVECTRAIIRMKLYTLWIKIIELDNYLGKRDQVDASKSKTTKKTIKTTEFEEIDTTIRIHVNRFLECMAEYEKQWRFVKLPRTLTESSTAMQRHSDCGRDIKQQWVQIQGQLTPLAKTLTQAKQLLERANQRREEWEASWALHQRRLDVRHDILVRLDQWEREVYKPRDTGLTQMIQLVKWENSESIDKWNERIHQWREDVPSLDERLEGILLDIRASSQSTTQDYSMAENDFINDPNVIQQQENWKKYIRRLQAVDYLMKEVLYIHQKVLIHVDQFVAEWPSRFQQCKRSNDNALWQKLSNDARNVRDRIQKVNEVKLRQLATDVYGDDTPIEPLLRRLRPYPLNGSDDFSEVINFIIIERTTITSTIPQWELPPPSFKKPLKDEHFTPGSNVDLHCRIVLLPDVRPIVSWFKDDVLLTPAKCSSLGYETDFNDRTGDCYLSIVKAEPHHVGTYVCVVRNSEDGQDCRSSARLTMDDTLKARLLGPLTAPRQLSSGQEIHLYVKFEGVPTPLVTWYKDNKVLEGDARRIYISTSSTDSALKIKPARSSDSGTYAVEVRNSSACDSSVVTIQIIDELIPPKFIRGRDLQDQHVTEGDRVFLRVELHSLVSTTSSSSSSVDDMRIIWSKDGRVITPFNTHYQISTLGHECRLVIPEVVESDAGHYRISVENDAGKIECSAHIFVQPLTAIVHQEVSREVIHTRSVPAPPQLHHDEVDSNGIQRTTIVLTNTVVRSPPEFLTLFTDEVCSPGDAVVFTAQVVGLPKPAVWWSYNGQFLQANSERGSRCEFAEEPLDGQLGTRYSLVMERVTSADAGRYSLTAENSTGLATCSALLLIADAKADLLHHSSHVGLSISEATSRYNSLGGRSLPRERGGALQFSSVSVENSRPITPVGGGHFHLQSMKELASSPLSPHTHLSYVSASTANQPGVHTVEITPKMQSHVFQSNSSSAYSGVVRSSGDAHTETNYRQMESSRVDPLRSSSSGKAHVETTYRQVEVSRDDLMRARSNVHVESNYRQGELSGDNHPGILRNTRQQIIYAQTDSNYDSQRYSAGSVVESSDFEDP